MCESDLPEYIEFENKKSLEKSYSPSKVTTDASKNEKKRHFDKNYFFDKTKILGTFSIPYLSTLGRVDSSYHFSEKKNIFSPNLGGSGSEPPKKSDPTSKSCNFF